MVEQKEMSDDEALAKIAFAMKDNAPVQDEKHNVHTFLHDVVIAPDTTKIGYLQVDKDKDELGDPEYTVRGCKELARIAGKIMDNKFFEDYFKSEVEDTLATSLSREGFIIKQGTTTTKQIADVTKRRKINKGWFGKAKIEESGGDTTTTTSQ